MSTNLQSDITEVRARLGEPYRADEADSFFLDSEIIDWLYAGELKVWNDLPAQVIADRSNLSVVDDFLCASSDLPSYVSDGFEPSTVALLDYKVAGVYLRVSSGNTVAGVRVSEQQIQMIAGGSRSTNFLRRDCVSVSGTNQLLGRFFYHELPNGSILSTAGNASDQIQVRCVKAPTRRYKHLRDTSQATSNATTITMSTAASAIFTTANFFQNCGIKIVSGNMSGVQSTVTSQTAATPNVITMSTIGFLPGNVFLYEMGEPGVYNDSLREPSILHACYLAALKDESPERSQGFMALYERAIAALKGPSS